jgi:alpha,alpha-trehalase
MGSEPLGKHLAFFLDYDGTLAPIAARPEEARMPESVRELVWQLACLCTVAIVSGRDRADVEKRVGLPGLIYAGSHGFDISGPDGLAMQHPEADAYLPDLNNADKVLNHLLKDVEGARLERKRYALAVHYRNVPEAHIAYVKDAVYRINRSTDRLTLTTGKQVLELRPALDWHKGKAVGWIMEALGLELAKVVPIYLGDDVTDEDAFRFVRDTGWASWWAGTAAPPTPCTAWKTSARWNSCC